MNWTADQLDQFVAKSDSLGGPGTPGCQHLWASFSYEPTHQVDQALDPYSEAYVAEQVRLYEEISGRRYDVQKNEHTEFDVDLHIAAPNPYNHPDPGGLAIHLQRLARALRYAKPRRGETLLDMGCGWGLSSEIAAYLGLNVTAVDVNPSFVRLVNERAKRDGRAVSAVASTFEEFAPAEPADIALFYECLHHAVRPWIVVDHLAAALRRGGRLVLAGEPINAHWWKHWGMRLDPISVYCIRKFGWFESGWSIDFIRQILHRSGLVPTTYFDADLDVGYAIVAEKKQVHRVPGNLALELFDATGCIRDADWLIFVGSGTLNLFFPLNAVKATLNLTSFRDRDLRVSVSNDDVPLFKGNMGPGPIILEVPRLGDIAKIRFEVERWVPDEEIHNGDGRTLGLHLENVIFELE